MKLRSLRYILREALGSIRVNGFMSVASVTTVTIALLVLALFLVLATNLEALATTLENQVEVKAYLASETTPARAKVLEGQIAGLPGVKSVKYVSKEEALQRLRQAFGQKQELLDSVEQMNPLRDSFDVKVVGPEQVKGVAEQIKSLGGVQDVDYKAEIVDRLFSLTRALRTAGLGVAVILALATVFIISNTIRLTIFARRREIAIMKLVGATDSFIRRPFVLEGMLIGLLGAAVAAVLIWRVYAWTTQAVTQSLPFLPLVPEDPLARNVALALGALGAALGAAGSALAIRRFLRV